MSFPDEISVKDKNNENIKFEGRGIADTGIHFT